MKPCYVICIVLLFNSFATVQGSTFQDEENKTLEPTLPSDWLGVWMGVMVITNPKNEKMTVPLQMEIASIRGSNKLSWMTSYGDPESKKQQPRVVKKYELVPESGKSGRFMIDEKNGIKLPARLVGNVLYSQFVVGGSSITARYELDEDQLQFEIVSTSKAPAGDEIQSVETFNINVIQRVKMKRKK